MSPIAIHYSSEFLQNTTLNSEALQESDYFKFCSFLFSIKINLTQKHFFRNNKIIKKLAKLKISIWFAAFCFTNALGF